MSREENKRVREEHEGGEKEVEGVMFQRIPKKRRTPLRFKGEGKGKEVE